MGRDYSKELLDAIQRADRAGASAVVEAWAVGRDFKSVVPELLTPTLETFGNLWGVGSDRVSLATGYVASKVAEDVFSRLLQEFGPSGAPGALGKGPVLLGNVEDDFHPLGRKMVVSFSGRMAGRSTTWAQMFPRSTFWTEPRRPEPGSSAPRP